MITSDRMSIVVPGLDSTAKVGALQNGLNHSFVNFFHDDAHHDHEAILIIS